MEGQYLVCKNITLNLKGKDENSIEEEYIPQKNINNNPNSISKKETKYINSQMEKCICKIKINDDKDNKYGTGFFCNIPFPDYSNLMPVLITSNNILGEKEIIPGNKINLLINDDSYSYTIHFDDSRLTYTNKDYDITIIELKKDDNLNVCGIEIDYDFYQTFVPSNKLSVYILFYSNLIYSECLFGVVNKKTEDNCYFQYTYLKENNEESISPTSGCPIINLNNFKVIGIHKSKQNNKKYNVGSVIKWPIEEFKKTYEIIYKNKSNQNNYFILKNINDLQKENEEISYEKLLFFDLPGNNRLLIPCSGKTIFSDIEKIIYKKYPQYYDKDNFFITEKELIDPDKTIDENNCDDRDCITLIQKEKEEFQDNQNTSKFSSNSNIFKNNTQYLMNNIQNNNPFDYEMNRIFYQQEDI